MIRRSLVIAVAAALLSLLLHLMGITATTRVAVVDQAEQNQADVVELTNEFEDLAETEAAPVEAEAAPEPEPVEAQPPEPEPAQEPPEPEEAEAPPEPKEAEEPTSQALVASANPQRTFAPDTGTVETGRRSTLGDSGTDEPGESDPNTEQPADGEPGELAEAATSPPVSTEPVEPPSQGNPDGAQDPATENNPEIVQTPGEDDSDAAPDEALERLAALPAPTAPAPSITAPVTPSAIPVIPLETETVESENPEQLEPLPEIAPDANDQQTETDLAAAAVVTSPRPRLRQPQTSSEPLGVPNAPLTLREFLKNPDGVIESPLAAYRRDGVDPFLRGGGGNRGGNGFVTARGPGNSDVTNYAGEVLVHLNRTRRIAVSGRGWARVVFRINPDGTLASVDILDGSGSPQVDRAAKAQVRAASPLPRPPNGETRVLNFVYTSR